MKHLKPILFDIEYHVSECGDVFRDGNPLRQEICHGNYRRVRVLIGGKMKRMFVHRVVAFAFISNPENKPFVGHIDNDPSNNHASNLIWCTQSENIRHMFSCGRNYKGCRNPNKGTNHYKHRPVNQHDMQGVLIKSFAYIRLASIETGVQENNIRASAMGTRKQAGGFIWSF